MTKLTKINKTTWVILALIIIASLVLLCFLLSYKIDKTIKAKLFVDENKNVYLMTKNEASYFIKSNQKMILQINSKNYELIIHKITIKNNFIFINFFSFPKELKLLPNTEIDSIVFLEKNSLIHLLLHF